jgi:hypothetical protein
MPKEETELMIHCPHCNSELYLYRRLKKAHLYSLIMGDASLVECSHCDALVPFRLEVIAHVCSPPGENDNKFSPPL